MSRDPRPPHPELPRSLQAPVDGVPFSAYLTVEAARLDHLPDAAVLAWLEIKQAAFGRAEERWADRLADALAADPVPGQPPFDEVYEELLGQALFRWARAVAPLDRDVAAWITFQRQALAAGDPAAFARDLGLTPGDELRLACHWRHRMTDPEVSARARAALDGPLPPMPALAVSPIVFPPGKEPA